MNLSKFTLPILVEPSSDEEDTRQRMLKIRGGYFNNIKFSQWYFSHSTEEARKRRRKRTTCRYNLRQFSAPEVKIRPCQVNLPRLPKRVCSENFLWQEYVRREVLETDSVVNWISPGPNSPDILGDDSIDELIKSSSDSGLLSVELFLILFLFLFGRGQQQQRGDLVLGHGKPPAAQRLESTYKGMMSSLPLTSQ